MRVELVDGILPDTGAYIEVGLPEKWLTEDGLRGLDGDGTSIYIDLVSLLESRLLAGVNDLDTPPKTEAARAVLALRKYADYLESEFVG